jgi:hypothetical protein
MGEGGGGGSETMITSGTACSLSISSGTAGTAAAVVCGGRFSVAPRSRSRSLSSEPVSEGGKAPSRLCPDGVF